MVCASDFQLEIHLNNDQKPRLPHIIQLILIVDALFSQKTRRFSGGYAIRIVRSVSNIGSY